MEGSVAGTDTGILSVGGAHSITTEIDPTVIAARAGTPVEQGNALRTLDDKTGDPHKTDSVVRDGIPPREGKSDESCTVEVRFKPVIGPTNHAFIVTTDADSINYFRGGPQANETGTNSSSSGSAGKDHTTYDPHFGIYGPIVTKHGAYRPNTVDWTTTPSGKQTVAKVPGNCDAIETGFVHHLDDIKTARINYEPASANSNSVVHETLERSGFRGVSPVVWAPAWNAPLAHRH